MLLDFQIPADFPDTFFFFGVNFQFISVLIREKNYELKILSLLRISLGTENTSYVFEKNTSVLFGGKICNDVFQATLTSIRSLRPSVPSSTSVG